ncbi:LysR family transcriptional regulator [Variovorax terrae]|uniref:LysR family transcriptional regulator n=1 Tax=Variovorax terrae TaxID=2923278 RepID=A0A9X2ALA5_9BURK|nr:LysR family transcriptional regulator [Variovorax terrae]MCJ0762109.1 LysR family transcriptional regulator [Variovorax terrae]
MDRLLSMRVFQRVIDEGGFAAAARALEMSPAVVTRLVSDLEQHLGTRLIQRTTRKLALTEAGEAYLLRLRGILHEVDDAEAVAAASTRELQGTLHVLATPVLASYFLAPRVAQWCERHPKVTLDLSIDPFPQNRVEEFDVTFIVVEEGYDASVVARPLISNDWIVCASPGYLQRHGTPRTPQELQHHGYLRFPWQQASGHSGRRLRLRPLEGEGEPVEVEMPVVLQSVSFDVLYRAALDGAGVAVLSKLLVAPHLASGALVQLLPDWVFGRFTIYAALPTRKLLPARTRAFMTFLFESVEQAAAARGLKV